MPKPQAGESHDEFIDRCMGDAEAVQDFPDANQRLAFCESVWEQERAMSETTMERRVLGLEHAELRLHEGEDGPRLEGYAAVFNSLSQDLGGFKEVFRPGAFDDALEASDVRSLANHNPNKLLGRQGNGTLRLTVDDRGLRYSVDLPDTPTAAEIRTLVERRDITGSSLSFSVAEDGDSFESRANGLVRFVDSVARIGDVGPVTFPAYEATEVSARSLEMAREAEKPSEEPDERDPVLTYDDEKHLLG